MALLFEEFSFMAPAKRKVELLDRGYPEPRMVVDVRRGTAWQSWFEDMFQRQFPIGRAIAADVAERILLFLWGT